MISLYQLGSQYIAESTEVLRQRDRLFARLGSVCGIERFEIKEKIDMLNEMADECRRTGEQLLSYYKDKKTSDTIFFSEFV